MLLTVDQAADRLGTSVRFIRRLRSERRITIVKLGKHIRIDSTDLDAYIAASRQECGNPTACPPAGETRHEAGKAPQPCWQESQPCWQESQPCWQECQPCGQDSKANISRVAAHFHPPIAPTSR